jgi:hypothetical protein
MPRYHNTSIMLEHRIMSEVVRLRSRKKFEGHLALLSGSMSK